MEVIGGEGLLYTLGWWSPTAVSERGREPFSGVKDDFWQVLSTYTCSDALCSTRKLTNWGTDLTTFIHFKDLGKIPFTGSFSRQVGC